MLPLVDIVANLILKNYEKYVKYKGISSETTPLSLIEQARLHLPIDLLEALETKKITKYYCIKIPEISDEQFRKKILSLCDAFTANFHSAENEISGTIENNVSAAEYLELSKERYIITQMFLLSIKYGRIKMHQVKEIHKNHYDLLQLLSDAYMYDPELWSKINDVAYSVGYERVPSTFPYPALMNISV